MSVLPTHHVIALSLAIDLAVDSLICFNYDLPSGFRKSRFHGFYLFIPGLVSGPTSRVDSTNQTQNEGVNDSLGSMRCRLAVDKYRPLIKASRILIMI